MVDLEEVLHTGETIWFDSKVLSECPPHYFEPDFWHQNQAITGQATGRGTTFFIRHESHELVLRHYKRGGLIGRFIHDHYLYFGMQNTRAWRELHLLLTLNELQLPAPKPVAARVQRGLFWYSADVITQRIPQAQDLHQVLCNKPLLENQWFEVGRIIRQFHDAQVYHHDLNIHNIMVDSKQKIWLIDFDKCGFRSGEKWKHKNLDRLQRSLQKESQKHTSYHWQLEDWKCLLNGYQK